MKLMQMREVEIIPNMLKIYMKLVIMAEEIKMAMLGVMYL